MIKVKYLLDPVDPDDGQRIWVERYGLTKDLQEWCQVDHVITEVAPSPALLYHLERDPDGFHVFRKAYASELHNSAWRDPLEKLALASRSGNLTLVHTSNDVDRNGAVALCQYLNEIAVSLLPDFDI
jgi:uncharacterized protein YeaO (DUF488 family)